MTFEASVPDEPLELKPAIAEQTAAGEFTLTDEHDWVVPITEPAPGRIRIGTEIAAHVWRAWEADLREAGFDYPTFVRLTTYSADRIGEWATDETSWKDVVDDLRDRIEEAGPALVADLSSS